MAQMVDARILVKLNDFARIAAAIPNDVQDGLVLAGNNTIRRARPLTPFRTGYLANSPQLDIGTLVVIVFWAAFYAPYQEFGTRRGIRPKRFAQISAELEMKALEAYLAALESRL
jgi:hypothetical protein